MINTSDFTVYDLKPQIHWWERKRWMYNAVLLIICLLAIYDVMQMMDYKWSVDDFIVIVVWALGANVFYSSGLLLEVLDYYYFNNKVKIKNIRWFLFFSGLFLSIILSLITIYSQILFLL